MGPFCQIMDRLLRLGTWNLERGTTPTWDSELINLRVRRGLVAVGSEVEYRDCTGRTAYTPPVAIRWLPDRNICFSVTILIGRYARTVERLKMEWPNRTVSD